MHAVVRARPEDFRVDEVLGYEPSGDGPHVWLRLRKRGANTGWVAREIAQLAGIAPREIGYAGLKDRTAVCSQWFSVHLPGGVEPDWGALASDRIEVLARARHRRKLRRGAFRRNAFTIVLRDLSDAPASLAARLQRVASRGAPNYFAEQRFGRDAANVRKAYEMLCRGRVVRNRHERGLYLSSARSLLFNYVLSHRVADGTWDRAQAGEIVMLDGSHSVFRVDTVDADIEARLQRLDLHPTGPLWGRIRRPLSDQALAREAALLGECGIWRQGLERAGLEHARRSLRVKVSRLEWEARAGASLELRFSLPSGSYATAVLRELVRTAPGFSGS